jgi:hypothetical protein
VEIGPGGTAPHEGVGGGPLEGSRPGMSIVSTERYAKLSKATKREDHAAPYARSVGSEDYQDQTGDSVVRSDATRGPMGGTKPPSVELTTQKDAHGAEPSRNPTTPPTR